MVKNVQIMKRAKISKVCMYQLHTYFEDKLREIMKPNGKHKLSISF